ncbi:MAG: glycogen synthase [Candidatus Melainabacteria bacterium]
MHVVYCAAEVAPFAKVGGLADVLGSLPKAMAQSKAAQLAGLKQTLIMPLYGCIDTGKYGITKTDRAFAVQDGGQDYPISVWEGKLPGSDVPVCFIDNVELMSSRQTVYPYGQPELEMRCFRVFSLAVFQLLNQLGIEPDILHIHDWHTAQLAKTLKQLQSEGRFTKTRSILTIHNLAYQGVWDDTNQLRDGLEAADHLTTVSPTYAREILTPEYGEGLQDLLNRRQKQLTGILNGIDPEVFDPGSDAFIPFHFDAGKPQPGKGGCKEALQQELGLPVDPNVPLIGFVSRLVDQKGLDILMPVIDELAGENIQWAILGSGDPKYEEALKRWNETTTQIRCYVGFNLAIAQKIYAGSDFFMMPSRFEPCGLGQLIALRYGSIPVVRAVGGLADTIVDADASPGTGNGYSFADYTSDALKATVDRAIRAYHQRDAFNALVQRAMQQDFSWTRSAEVYLDLFRQVLNQAPAGVA